ncbi:hypothetical protein Glove_117g432 [Diversispora epigaea]|uniref:Uncharacterized protein n=1 Tax=Diversispora epigaea TaxID=1348612 RepID=A0A397J6X8_9GLOM|nr:hypothetical protein Glove_117g432 [Diversispora epigaea]
MKLNLILFFVDITTKVNVLTKNLNEFPKDKNNEIFKILNAADELGLTKLIEFIQEYLIMNKIKILNQDPTIICPIDIKVLKILLKIFRNIKWGIEQTPELKDDPEKLTDQDFITLKERLHNCIMLIRFRQISAENFYLKVWPFKKLFLKNLLMIF